MKPKLTILFLTLLFALGMSAQRKAQIEPVTKDNQIDGSPYITLPQTALKVKFSIAAFTYSGGDKLYKLIHLKTPYCSDEKIKEKLKPLSERYDINIDAVIKLLKAHNKKNDSSEITIYKLDKDMKTSLASAADYDKIFRYKRFKNSPFNSSLLSLEYDDNGVLITSKQTNESKLGPAIFSTLSGLISFAGAIKGPQDLSSITQPKDDECMTIDYDCLRTLDSLMNQYNVALKTSSNFLTDAHFSKAAEKYEQEIKKEFENVFYGKEVKMTPIEITFILPKDSIPENGNDKLLKLFSFKSSSHSIALNPKFKDYLFLTPLDAYCDTCFVDSIAYSVKLSAVPSLYDKSLSLANKLGNKPDKITAVYNIPKTERVRFQSPSGEAYIDTIAKVPQHGKLGYYSIKTSSLELTYDSNGELKKISAEKKSSIDTNVTAGA